MIFNAFCYCSLPPPCDHIKQNVELQKVIETERQQTSTEPRSNQETSRVKTMHLDPTLKRLKNSKIFFFSQPDANDETRHDTAFLTTTESSIVPATPRPTNADTVTEWLEARARIVATTTNGTA